MIFATTFVILIYSNSENYSIEIPTTVEPQILFTHTKDTVLIGVFSIQSKIKQRALIRTTYKYFKNPTIQVMFVIAKPIKNDVNLDIQVQAEHQVYQDLIILDGNENMNHGKTYWFFKYVYDHYSQFKMVVKADSDTFLHLDNLEARFKEFPDTPVYWGRLGSHLSKNISSFTFMRGMVYGVSWEIVEFIATDATIAKHIIGHEDRITARWVDLFEKKANVTHIKESESVIYDFSYENEKPYNSNDTLAVHKLKTDFRWVNCAAFFIPKFVKPFSLRFSALFRNYD